MIINRVLRNLKHKLFNLIFKNQKLINKKIFVFSRNVLRARMLSNSSKCLTRMILLAVLLCGPRVMDGFVAALGDK